MTLPKVVRARMGHPLPTFYLHTCVYACRVRRPLLGAVGARHALFYSSFLGGAAHQPRDRLKPPTG
jgi:hypothetical protein